MRENEVFFYEKKKTTIVGVTKLNQYGKLRPIINYKEKIKNNT